MSDKEVDESKTKRGPDSSDGNDDDEKRATRKKARVDYSEDKSKANQATNEKEEAEEEEEEDDDEIQDVTPANIKSKSEEPVNEPRPTRSTSDDLMGLPMEPTGLEGAGITTELFPIIPIYKEIFVNFQPFKVVCPLIR